MKTEVEIVKIISAMTDAMVLAHGQPDDYTRGIMDFSEMLARAFVTSTYMFSPAAREAMRQWRFETTDAALIVIEPGEM